MNDPLNDQIKKIHDKLDRIISILEDKELTEKKIPFKYMDVDKFAREFLPHNLSSPILKRHDYSITTVETLYRRGKRLRHVGKIKHERIREIIDHHLAKLGETMDTYDIETKKQLYDRIGKEERYSVFSPYGVVDIISVKEGEVTLYQNNLLRETIKISVEGFLKAMDKQSQSITR